MAIVIRADDISPAALPALITEKVDEFDKWVQANLGSPMGGPLDKAERAILQTFLYRELTRKESLADLPHVPLPTI